MKHHLADLALFGGPREFMQPRHVGQPNLPEWGRFSGLLSTAFSSSRLTNDGPLVREFECMVAEYLQVGHCVAVCNATTGLQLTAMAMQLRGKVVMPALTFIGTAHAMRWVGLEPIFCDVEPDTGLLDPDSVDNVSKGASAILGVHLWGRPCALGRLDAVANQRGIPIFYDAAHAFGCQALGRPIGGFGDAEVFSFHATKIVNTFEGGAITTNDRDLARRLRTMRNFGFDGRDASVRIGTNAKMSEASAAMGIAGLGCLSRFVEHNRQNYAAYAAGLRGVPGVCLAQPADNHHYVVGIVSDSDMGLTRDELLCVLHDEGVLVRRYFWPGCHKVPPYCDAFLPITDRLLGHLMQFPTGMAVSVQDVEATCSILRVAARHPNAIRAALKGRLCTS